MIKGRLRPDRRTRQRERPRSPPPSPAPLAGDVPWAHLDIAGASYDVAPRVLRRQGRHGTRAAAGRPGATHSRLQPTTPRKLASASRPRSDRREANIPTRRGRGRHRSDAAEQRRQQRDQVGQGRDPAPVLAGASRQHDSPNRSDGRIASSIRSSTSIASAGLSGRGSRHAHDRHDRGASPPSAARRAGRSGVPPAVRIRAWSSIYPTTTACCNGPSASSPSRRSRRWPRSSTGRRPSPTTSCAAWASST